MALIPVPQPYDFTTSLDRFTYWGVDRANVWHDGGLHRVVAGREVRITAAPGGVNAEPLDDVIEPAVRKLIGLDFDLTTFHAFAQGEEVLAATVERFPGFRPPLAIKMTAYVLVAPLMGVFAERLPRRAVNRRESLVCVQRDAAVCCFSRRSVSRVRAFACSET